MDASINRMAGFPVGILSAMIVTASLFAALPLLTRFQKPHSHQQTAPPVLIDIRKPLPPPLEKRDETRKQALPEKKFTGNKKDRPLKAQPNVNTSRGISSGARIGDISIGISPGFKDMAPMPNMTYGTEEVDQPPRLLRSFPPQYPYIAKRDGLEGWVVLQFVVSSEGAAGRLEVVAADPPGIFEEAALKAVSRYRFKPAIKNGKTVNCLIRQRIRFTLD